MSYEEILKELKTGTYRPIYFLMGEEPYYIDVISDYIAQNALSESEKGFNQLVMYGKDTDATNVIHSARRYPMMAQRQVVIVKEAQNLKDIDLLENYALNPLNSTVLVICYKYKSYDKRKKLIKLVEINGVVLETKKLYDNQIPKWIEGYAKSQGIALNDKATLLLAEFIGSDLSAIVSAVTKLKVAVPQDVKEITPELIEKNIGFSKEYNNFELQSAIINKDHLKAVKIVRYFALNPKSNSIQASIAVLFGFFQKLMAFHYLPDKSQSAAASALKVNPYFIKDYMTGAKNYNARKAMSVISLLRDYDMKSKGFESPAVSDAELLNEMIFKIIYQ